MKDELVPKVKSLLIQNEKEIKLIFFTLNGSVFRELKFIMPKGKKEKLMKKKLFNLIAKVLLTKEDYYTFEHYFLDKFTEPVKSGEIETWITPEGVVTHTPKSK